MGLLDHFFYGPFGPLMGLLAPLMGLLAISFFLPGAEGPLWGPEGRHEDPRGRRYFTLGWVAGRAPWPERPHGCDRKPRACRLRSARASWRYWHLPCGLGGLPGWLVPSSTVGA